MSNLLQAENQRINLRVRNHAKTLIEHAAALEGKTVSNFILSSALASAQHTIAAHETIRLKEEEARRFLDALIQPVCFNSELREAFAEHEQRVDSK